MFFGVFNFVESVFWMGLGVGLVVYDFMKSKGGMVLKVLGGVFVVFGVSDIVEVYSGAWWRPWWLLVWKGSCVFVIVWGILYLWRKGGTR